MKAQSRRQQGQALACSAESAMPSSSKKLVCCVRVVHGHLGGSVGHVLGSEQPKAAAGRKSLFKATVNPLSPGSAVAGLPKHKSRTVLFRRSANPQQCRARACCGYASSDVLLGWELQRTQCERQQSKGRRGFVQSLNALLTWLLVVLRLGSCGGYLVRFGPGAAQRPVPWAPLG